MSEPHVILEYGEYIARMEKAGLFSAQAANCEHDPRIWRHYFEICDKKIDFQFEGDVSFHCGKYGFCYEPDDPDRIGFNWSLVTPMVDPFIPVTFEQFKQDLPALRESILTNLDYNVITDTFGFLDGYGNSASDMVRLQSPVAALYPTFAAYLESLSGKRRKKYRHLFESFDSLDFRFELSQTPLSTTEMEFAERQLEKRWGEDSPYALIQTLWSQSCAAIRPEKALFMRVYSKDALIFVQTMLVRGNGVYCQSIFKNEDMFFDGIAPYTDFKCIEALCGSQYEFLDPSCRCAIDDPPSIGIAKRATVNMNKTKPLLLIGRNLPEEALTALASAVPLGDEL